MNNKFYITTPIYYPNSKPHIGTLYSTIIADVSARFHRLQGQQTFFVTGTDEHGQKVAEAAATAGMQPKAFVDSMIDPFKKVWTTYDLAYNRFIRTTDTDHEQAVVELVKRLMDKNEIYKSVYSGLYCTPCETFVNQPEMIEGKPVCTTCHRPVKEVAEESYFFRLSAWQDKLLAFYEQHPHFVTPSERMHEVVSFVKAGLKDLSISRKSVTWGIPFPGDPTHTIYVWIDGFTAYLSPVGFGDQSAEGKRSFNQWWPADAHVMAKDILKFHAIYWPALLMAANLAVPKRLVVHGYILMGDHKMSKSRGNVIDPLFLAEQYGPEQIRYYLMRQMAITHDGHFDLQDLEARITADLSNSLGNLLSRVTTLAAQNKFDQLTPPDAWEAASGALKEKYEEAFRSYWDEMNHYNFHLALAAVWKLIAEVNAYIHEQKPWVAAKQNRELCAEILSAACQALYGIGIMLWPFMPTKMEQLLAALGHHPSWGTRDYIDELRNHSWRLIFGPRSGAAALFPRPVSSIIESAEATPATATPEKSSSAITIDDFTKVEMHVGTILQCERLKNSEKLLRLQVDFGPLGQRQILSGVAQHVTPEYLIGRQGVFVTNLAPRKMAGEISHGMMLFVADENKKQVDVTIGRHVPNGTRLT